MACDICLRDFNDARRKPVCQGCALAALYPRRYDQAIALLDRERYHAQAEAVVRPYNDGLLAALPVDADLEVLGAISKKHNSQIRLEQCVAIDGRVNLILEKTEELRKQTEELKEFTIRKREELAKRRKELETERKEADKSKTRLRDPIQASISRTLPRLERLRSKIADARHLLCREAAVAMNLGKRKTWNGRTEYLIGGIPIPDLRELHARSTQPPQPTSPHQTFQTRPPTGARSVNAEPHDLLSASLDNVARFLNLCAHYLQLRPPAEIILSHANTPRAAILAERSSYRGSSNSRTNHLPSSTTPSDNPYDSTSSSRLLDATRWGRPRPLSIDRGLAELARDEPKSYGLFIEGAALLAWDLAWLCRTQGVERVESWEEFCAIGRNLWLLVHSPPRVSRGDSRRGGREGRGVSGGGDEGSVRRGAVEPVASLGVFSHNSAGSNLAGAEGLALMKDWKLASSSRLTDALKAFLLNEMSGAEWDVIEEKEWKEAREGEQPVLVGGMAHPRDSRHVAMSVISVKPSDGMEEEETNKSSNGWMKLRGRNGT